MTEELTLPYQLGRYTLLRPLGRGGMGVVYVARDERLDRDVAVKMIAGLSDESSIKRFWREARAAASVSHPNVCQIYEVDEHAAGIYLAMELLEGESLETRLKRGVCPPAEARRGQGSGNLAITNVSRNSRAHGDASSLPAPSGYGAESPSVFARRTKVSPCDGILMTSVEEAVQ
jgi:hypothetical protein